MRDQTPNRTTAAAHPVTAGLIYAAAVFSFAFVTGVLRTVALAQLPDASPVIGVMIELPAILLVAWIICGWVVARVGVARDFGVRLAMGVTAFAAIVLAEAALSAVVAGRGIDGFVASFAQAETLLGLGGQIVYALFPLMRR